MAAIATAIAPTFVAIVTALATLGAVAVFVLLAANLGEAEHRQRQHDKAGGDRYAEKPPREPCPNGLARLAAQGQARRREARARRQARLNQAAE